MVNPVRKGEWECQGGHAKEKARCVVFLIAVANKKNKEETQGGKNYLGWWFQRDFSPEWRGKAWLAGDG